MKIDIDKIINQIDKNWTRDEIVKFVHIELGKQLIYDNSYSNNKQDKNDKNSDMTEMSKKRREKLLYLDTNLDTTEQICKSMAEISAAIFNKLGIKARVIGVEGKGDIDGAIRKDSRETIVVPEIYSVALNGNSIKAGKNEQTKQTDTRAKHYYTEIFVDGKEPIIQDYLMEGALARIKMGESTVQDDIIPGLCTEDDYAAREGNPIPIKNSYKDKLDNELKQKYGADNNLNDKVQFILEKLDQAELEFGFEEAKEYVWFLSKSMTNAQEQTKTQGNIRLCNLIKETENSADVVCVYGINNQNYFVRGNLDRLGELPQVGKIKEEQINEILKIGFEPREKSDKEFLENQISNYVFKTSPKEIVNYATENDSSYINEYGEIIRPDNQETEQDNSYKIKPQQIGKNIINTPIQAKQEAEKVEAENIHTKDKVNEGESLDDN